MHPSGIRIIPRFGSKRLSGKDDKNPTGPTATAGLVSEWGKDFIALPEKALLDLIYLQPRGDPAYLSKLRLQAIERLHLDALARLAEASGSPKLRGRRSSSQ